MELLENDIEDISTEDLISKFDIYFTPQSFKDLFGNIILDSISTSYETIKCEYQKMDNPF